MDCAVPAKAGTKSIYDRLRVVGRVGLSSWIIANGAMVGRLCCLGHVLVLHKKSRGAGVVTKLCFHFPLFAQLLNETLLGSTYPNIHSHIRRHIVVRLTSARVVKRHAM